MKEGVLAQATIRGLSRRVQDLEDLYSVIYDLSESETEEVEVMANGAVPNASEMTLGRCRVPYFSQNDGY